ncbi:MAG TPA: dTDP-glucose 4,6-dehydratase [Devosia sp.]|jgi:dTDP-glucose 4,6-dehydratase|uniref:dTDP-glucose 4,6-dehydratase n=1 Tax=Devosia sp. TaxID=1871048 RepID=UPI002DDCD076|nr:dTDP-glucose 4,6-dehydratase [Devosia sp.]HEV2516473.1 dTDP-glucose 4,6-dehydratase [Devosia sp.]
MTILVTGGAGFIGSNFVLDWLAANDEPVVTLDALTYAGNLANLAPLNGDSRHQFVRGSIGDGALVGRLLRGNEVRAVINFAAESHVDRSISGPAPFFETNVMGTLHLLEAVKAYAAGLDQEKRQGFLFLHVSTDEVYGTLERDEAPFAETNPYKPNSPYAASKASSDHLVRAYRETYGLATIVTNCSNNYGPLQFPEKLIPLIIHNALNGKALPIYGDGLQVRDWLYVGDHCAALRRVLDAGVPGETYNIGGDNQKTNIEVVRTICALLDVRRPRADGASYAAQITHVTDRPGHDRRYAIDPTKLAGELGWRPAEAFEGGLAKTVDWYLANEAWVADVTSGAYREWVARQYG